LVQTIEKYLLYLPEKRAKKANSFSVAVDTLPGMDKLLESFREHPASVGETYVEHLGVATSFGLALLKAGLASLVHALFPFLFVTTGSLAIEELHRRMVTNRGRRTR
jgi:hypothetical protein